MSIGTSSPPVTRFVAQSVVRNARTAGIAGGSEIPTFRAELSPVLMTVANAVAGAPTNTERLDGRTDATSVVGLDVIADVITGAAARLAISTTSGVWITRRWEGGPSALASSTGIAPAATAPAISRTAVASASARVAQLGEPF